MSLYKHWLKYPQILEEKDWNKQKGILAKVAKGETGITAKLKKARKAFNAMEPARWSEITVDTSTKLSCAKAIKALDAEYSSTLKQCTDALLEVKQLAEQTALEFKKSKVIPKSSRKHVEAMANTAQEFSDAIRAFVLKARREIVDAAKNAA